MTNRERIINTALCKKTDRHPFFFYFGPWPEAAERWATEGLDRPENWALEFGFDPGIEIVNVNLGYYPAFDQKIIEDKGDRIIIVDSMGILQECRKDGSSIPYYLNYTVKNMEDWTPLSVLRRLSVLNDYFR